MVFFHFQAGCYAATIHDPAAFGSSSNVDVTFASVHAIDINIFAPDSFPPLAGVNGDVFFRAQFIDNSSRPIFTSDALPTNTALAPSSFDESALLLFTLSPTVIVASSALTSFKVTPLPEPSSAALTIPGALALLGMARRRASLPARQVARSKSRARA